MCTRPEHARNIWILDVLSYKQTINKLYIYFCWYYIIATLNLFYICIVCFLFLIQIADLLRNLFRFGYFAFITLSLKNNIQICCNTRHEYYFGILLCRREYLRINVCYECILFQFRD